ncbi:GcrA family cell cycle regulator [Rhizobium sp. LjRoot254]|uniref:GcrA family cell cycle regulator n=1 Tax=Rhizobium sp. LjRoot254 TaxID=3342297 RepID=UPI003F500C54
MDELPIQNRFRLRPLTQLRPHQCKWPVSEDRAEVGHFLFCCRPVAGTSPYCTHHHQMAIALPAKNTYRRPRLARR